MRSIKTLTASLVILSFLFVTPVVVFAEGPGSDPSFTNDQVQTQQTTQESTQQNKTDTLTEDNTRSFITGVGAGAVVGLIVGGVFAWLFKDKILSSK